MEQVYEPVPLNFLAPNIQILQLIIKKIMPIIGDRYDNNGVLSGLSITILGQYAIKAIGNTNVKMNLNTGLNIVIGYLA